MIPYFLDHKVKIVKACKYIVYKAGGPQTYTAWRALGETGPKALDPSPNKIATWVQIPKEEKQKGGWDGGGLSFWSIERGGRSWPVARDDHWGQK